MHTTAQVVVYVDNAAVVATKKECTPREVPCY